LGFTPENSANKNVASGYAGLDASSKLTGAQQVYGTAANTAAQGNDSRITGAEQTTNKNAASGYAGIDASSRLAAAQFPALTGSITTPGGSLATTLAALTTVTGALSSDVTMTTAGTFYDGPTNALTAAKWSLDGTVTLQTTLVSALDQFTCKLWDGTTVVASSEVVVGATASAAVKNVSITLSGIVTPAGAATWKISCTSNTASQLIKAATPQYGAGNNASTLNAVKLQ
jgi:hypothetical protein